jgi:hypothetical protein
LATRGVLEWAHSKEIIEQDREWCYLIATMKKLILLFSVVAVAFALQAGDDSSCSKDKKAACDKAKAAGCTTKAGAQASGCCAAKAGDSAKAGCSSMPGCPAKLAKADTAKKTAQSPKAGGEAK